VKLTPNPPAMYLPRIILIEFSAIYRAILKYLTTTSGLPVNERLIYLSVTGIRHSDARGLR